MNLCPSLGMGSASPGLSLLCLAGWSGMLEGRLGRPALSVPKVGATPTYLVASWEIGASMAARSLLGKGAAAMQCPLPWAQMVLAQVHRKV